MNRRWVLLVGLLLTSCEGKVTPVSPAPTTPSVLPATPSPSPSPSASRPPAAPEVLDFKVLSRFDYRERMELPLDVKYWNGRRIELTGYLNPTVQARDIKQFFLVKDRSACCYGTRPQINHYVDITLKGGKGINYSTDPVTVIGTLFIEDRWDGDWQLGLYWVEDGEIVR